MVDQTLTLPLPGTALDGTRPIIDHDDLILLGRLLAHHVVNTGVLDPLAGRLMDYAQARKITLHPLQLIPGVAFNHPSRVVFSCDTLDIGR
jgi:hypothetical protein